MKVHFDTHQQKEVVTDRFLLVVLSTQVLEEATFMPDDAVGNQRRGRSTTSIGPIVHRFCRNLPTDVTRGLEEGEKK